MTHHDISCSNAVKRDVGKTRCKSDVIYATALCCAICTSLSVIYLHRLKPKTNEYDQEIPQSYTAGQDQACFIMHFIEQQNQFHFERKLFAQLCVSVSVPFVPNVVDQHVSGFAACCVEPTHYKWKVSSYLWVMWHTMLVSVNAISVIL